MSLGCIESKLLPAKSNQIFQLEGWYIWGASVCKEEENYYMFASAWEKIHGFSGWVCHSTILMAVSTHPEGPYEFVREMKELKREKWSEEVLHNPTVHKINGKYFLYYVGTNGHESEQNEGQPNIYEKYRYNQKIGVAIGTTLKEELKPSINNPILSPSKTDWDNTYVTNPSILAHGNEVFMVYKALLKEELPNIVMKLGLAKASSLEGPFTRVQNKPIIDENIEDPCIWCENKEFYMIAKDMVGNLAGGPDEAVLYQSKDGISWESNCTKAYGISIQWEDGVTNYTNVERPQIYMENGVPVCLYNAVGYLPEGTFNVARRFKIDG